MSNKTKHGTDENNTIHTGSVKRGKKMVEMENETIEEDEIPKYFKDFDEIMKRTFTNYQKDLSKVKNLTLNSKRNENAVAGKDPFKSFLENRNRL